MAKKRTGNQRQRSRAKGLARVRKDREKHKKWRNMSFSERINARMRGSQGLVRQAAVELCILLIESEGQLYLIAASSVDDLTAGRGRQSFQSSNSDDDFVKLCGFLDDLEAGVMAEGKIVRLYFANEALEQRYETYLDTQEAASEDSAT